MKQSPLTLLLWLAALAMAISLWWLQRAEVAVPPPAEQATVDSAAAPAAPALPALPATTATGDSPHRAAAEAAPPIDTAVATATFDVVVVDADTKQPVAEAEAVWSDAQALDKVRKLPVEQAAAFWSDAELLAREFGGRARSDRAGRLRVTAHPQGCQVFARAGDRYGEILLSNRNTPPPGGHLLLLARDETLQVRVWDPEGRPAARASVGLSFGSDAAASSRRQYPLRASTDDAGLAVFRHLQRRRMLHYGQESSHATTGCVVGLRIPGLAVPPVVVDAILPLPKEAIELHLPPTGSLRLRFVVAGMPIHGLDAVRVHEGPKDSTEASNCGVDEQVDANGWAWFRWLPAGVPLFAKPQSMNVAFRDSHELPALGVGASVEHQIDLVDEAVVLRGRVLDPAGKPVSNTTLLLQYQFAGGSGSVGLATDAQGGFLQLMRRPQQQEPWLLSRFQLMALERQELLLSLPPRELHAGIQDLGVLHFGGEPLVCAGRLEGYVMRQHGVALVLERQVAERGSGAVTWRALEQPKVGVGMDGAFMARGQVEPGRYRLRIQARDYLPVAPIEFRLGQDDLVVPMHLGVPLEVVCQLPANANPQHLVLELFDGAARDPVVHETHGFGAPANNLRGLSDRAVGEAATFRWSAVEAGSYTLRVLLQGYAKPVLEVADVVLPLPQGGDARLNPLDLREHLRLVALRCVNATGAEQSGGLMVFLQPQAEPQRWSGAELDRRTARVLLPREAQQICVVGGDWRPTTLLVPAEVLEFPVTLESWPRIEVALADAVELPEGCELSVLATPTQKPRPGTYLVRSFGGGTSGQLDRLLRHGGSMVVLRPGGPAGSLELGDGPSVLSLTLRYGKGQRSLWRCTPSEVVAGAPVKITLDAGEVAAAAAALAVPKQGK